MNIHHQPLTNKQNTYRYMVYVMFMAVMALASCNANSGGVVNPSAATTKISVVNASPDVGPVIVAVGGGTRLGTYFRYPYPSSYYSVSNGPENIQLRDNKNITLITRNDTLAVNTSYSLFLMGINASSVSTESLSSMLVADTSSTPALGSGKVRFINVSPRTPGLDVTANGTRIFSSITYKGKSNYQQVPAGIYDFKIYAAGSSSVLVDVPLITIQDGRLYTLFTHGLTGRTDTAAIGAAVITNK
jgi:hypothetical protein